MTVPGDRKFTRTHEWVKIDGDIATVGITDFAQNELGDITYLELPGAGTSVTQSEPFGVVESVKAASDIYAPISGEVIEENLAAVDHPEVVNSSPFDDAWLLKIRISDPSQVDGLLNPADYERFIAESATH